MGNESKHDEDGHSNSDPRSAPIPGMPDLPSGELHVSWGDHIGELFCLYNECRIGRGGDNDLVFSDDSVSRHHIVLTKSGSTYRLRDLGSSSGTFVNGTKVQECLLADGDRIQIGSVLLAFSTDQRTIFDRHCMRHSKQPLVTALSRLANPRLLGDCEVSLILFDLDHLKRCNDVEGLYAGDAVLAHVEKIARSVVRPQDTFARIGGEEFAIVLPDLDLEAARAFAEDLRRRVEQSVCPFEDRMLRITISCGVAQWTDDIKMPWRLLRAADDQLYAAKRAGRNQVK